jgi:cysteine-rich repeat protein
VENLRTFLRLAGSALAGCVTEDAVETSEYGYHLSRDATSGGIPGFYFLAPLGDPPATFPSAFDGSLKRRLSIAIHDVDCTNQGTVGAAVQTYSTVLVYPTVEQYKVNHVVASSIYQIGHCYRVIPKLDGAALGFADVQVLQNIASTVPAAGYRKWGLGASKPIVFRLENMDPDGDGLASPVDNCPTTANASQVDSDGDGLGDACDPPDDTDGDGVPDTTDNCPTIANANQADSDSDGLGDACDSPCPTVPAAVGYWKGDGGGTAAVGSGVDLTTTGTIGFAAGRFGQAWSFTGAGFVRADGFDQPGAFTLSFWAKASQFQGVNFGLVSSAQLKNATTSTFQVDWNATKGYRFKAGGNTAPQLMVNIGQASLTQFQNIVVTYDGTSAVKVYLDGVQTGSGTWSGPQLGFSSIKIGTNRAENYNFRGLIDNVSVTDHVMTASEIAAVFAQPDSCVTGVVVAPCGNGQLDAGETCDDGNTADGDGCGHSCRIEACGDGLVQFGRGEECDDGNTTAGDGCDATCQSEPFVTTPPVQVAAGLSGCSTAVANTGRKLVVDGSGTIYAFLNCTGVASVVVSTNRGVTFSAPVDLSTALPNIGAGLSEIAIGTGPTGVAYAVVLLGNGEVYLRSTQNKGTTWSAATLLGTSGAPGIGVSLQAFNDDLYVSWAEPDGVTVARNHAHDPGRDGHRVLRPARRCGHADRRHRDRHARLPHPREHRPRGLVRRRGQPAGRRVLLGLGDR